MVIDSDNKQFLSEATRIGRWLEASALRHEGHASWIADKPRASTNGRTIPTIDCSLAGGTAGIGWFLARLAAITGDDQLANLAIEALRSSITGGSALCAEQRFGWYEGSLGAAWAAIDAGIMLSHDELKTEGIALVNEIVSNPLGFEQRRAALVGGIADVVAGRIGVTALLDEPSQVEGFEHWASGLVETLIDEREGVLTNHSQMTPGLAHGTTGIALALDAWSAATGRHHSAETLRRVRRAERAWFEPGLGWVAQPAHEWNIEEHYIADWSWCAGASGIGLARLASYVATGDLADLADLTAAIQMVRERLSVNEGNDTTLCHGISGELDFLVTTGALLSQPEHIAAAQRVGGKLLRVRGRAQNPVGRDQDQNPSLLYGLAGYGILMLRLYDRGLTPTPTLPSFLTVSSSVVKT